MVAELPAGNELVFLPEKKQTKPGVLPHGRPNQGILPWFLIVPLRGEIPGQFGWRR